MISGHIRGPGTADEPVDASLRPAAPSFCPPAAFPLRRDPGARRADPVPIHLPSAPGPLELRLRPSHCCLYHQHGLRSNHCHLLHPQGRDRYGSGFLSGHPPPWIPPDPGAHFDLLPDSRRAGPSPVAVRNPSCGRLDPVRRTPGVVCAGPHIPAPGRRKRGGGRETARRALLQSSIQAAAGERRLAPLLFNERPSLVRGARLPGDCTPSRRGGSFAPARGVPRRRRPASRIGASPPAAPRTSPRFRATPPSPTDRRRSSFASDPETLPGDAPSRS